MSTWFSNRHLPTGHFTVLSGHLPLWSYCRFFNCGPNGGMAIMRKVPDLLLVLLKSLHCNCNRWDRGMRLFSSRHENHPLEGVLDRKRCHQLDQRPRLPIVINWNFFRIVDRRMVIRFFLSASWRNDDFDRLMTSQTGNDVTSRSGPPICYWWSTQI